MRRSRIALGTLAALASLPWVAACADHGADASDDGTLRVYLARHGQTSWNAERRLQGKSDTELDDTGQAQARRLAGRVAGVALDAIYCSTLRRSRDTARVVAGERPLDSLEELDEQALGIFEGVYLDGQEPEAAAEFERRHRDPEDDLDGGESREQHFARVGRAVERIRREHRSGTILIVGHGGTNQMILRALLGLDGETAAGIRQSNDELYLIELPGSLPPRLWKLIDADRRAEL